MRLSVGCSPSNKSAVASSSCISFVIIPWAALGGIGGGAGEDAGTGPSGGAGPGGAAGGVGIEGGIAGGVGVDVASWCVYDHS